MKSVTKHALVYLAGGAAYGALELLWRGRTHWSMLAVGGLCVLILYFIATRSGQPGWKKCITGGVLITTVEFLAGIAVNIILGWGVWDYTTLKMNLLGQICPHFSLFWMALSVPAMWLLCAVDKRFFSKGGTRYDGAHSA